MCLKLSGIVLHDLKVVVVVVVVAVVVVVVVVVVVAEIGSREYPQVKMKSATTKTTITSLRHYRKKRT